MALILYGKNLRLPIIGKRCKRIKRNLDALLPVIAVDDGDARHGRHQCRHALLPVDQNLLPCRHRPVFQLDIRVLPHDQIARRITFIKGI